MIYTEVESHRASLRERWRVLSLVWRTAGEPDVPVKARRAARGLAVRGYVFALRPRVSSYIVNKNGDQP